MLSSPSELLRRLALVILGGMATLTALTLLVLPVLYEVSERRSGTVTPERAVERPA